MNEILSARDTAKYLNVSRQYVYLLYKIGRIKPIKEKPLLFEKRELDKYLESIKPKSLNDKRFKNYEVANETK